MVISKVIKELESKLDRNEIFVILEYILDKSKTEILTNLDHEINDKDI